jgi:hypothetical protein
MSIEICMAGFLALALIGAALARYAWVHWIMTEEEIEAEHRRLLGGSRRW